MWKWKLRTSKNDREIAIWILALVIPLMVVSVPMWLRRLGVDISEVSWLSEVFPICFIIFFWCILILFKTRNKDKEGTNECNNINKKLDELIENIGKLTDEKETENKHGDN